MPDRSNVARRGHSARSGVDGQARSAILILKGFEKRSASVLASYRTRTFPTSVDGLRADSTNLWNVNLQRTIHITGRVNLQFRADALNATNRSQFNGPDMSPTSTTFGKVTSQSAAMNRWLQFQIRLRY
jgi:hypothetical protein